MCRQSRRVFEQHYDVMHAIDSFEDAAFTAIARRKRKSAAARPDSPVLPEQLPQKERVTNTTGG
jgi:hypothetical protein